MRDDLDDGADLFDMDAALFSSAWKRAHPPTSIMLRPDDEFLFETRLAPSRPRYTPGPREIAATAYVAELGRRSPGWFGDRRPRWQIEAERNARGN